jgi:ribosomal-protein-alanine N-acetyltransferase
MRVPGSRVRAAGVADLVAVVAMERGVAEAPHWAEAEYAAIVNADGDRDSGVRRCLLVAEAEGRLLGFAVGKAIGSGAGSVAELESVVVEATTRREGVGRALCEAVVAWCREKKVATMELEVRAGSLGAISLYAGLGFVAVGRRGGYYREPVEDAMMMRLELGGDL